MNRRWKQGIFLSFRAIIKFNYVHYSTMDILQQLPLSSPSLISIVKFIAFEHTKLVELWSPVKQLVHILSGTWLVACLCM